MGNCSSCCHHNAGQGAARLPHVIDDDGELRGFEAEPGLYDLDVVNTLPATRATCGEAAEEEPMIFDAGAKEVDPTLGLSSSTTDSPGLVPDAPRDPSTRSIFEAMRKGASKTLGGPTIIVLVNPRSGGNAAGVLLEIPRGGVCIEAPGVGLATIFSYPIADPSREGVHHLAAEVHAGGMHPVRCIVAGGDGTVMWVIQEIFDSGIPTESVLIGTVPFGTGNDFGNVTGWGVSGPPRGFLKEHDGFSGLQKYVAAWLRAESSPFDIWQISVRTRSSDKAGFEFIQDGKKQCTEQHMERHSIKRLPGGELEMSKYVCNYLGIGLDARVGFGFDKSRQHNRHANKAVYAWEGTKKLLFKKKGVVGHIIDNMKTVESLHVDQARDGHDPAAARDRETVFSTASDDAQARLAGNPVSLLFLNIPSIAGGLDIWNWSSRKLGTATAGPELLARKQHFGDGRLECLTYRTGLGFYAEQTRIPGVRGQGQRVYSGGGPLRITFRHPSDESFRAGTGHCRGRTYMQVDGEYFAVHEPESVVIKQHATVRVLINSNPGGCSS
uniref:Diacylglycerol kinase n=1 Tax=Zooxanthella nutricula TaxID=1333877 RepID=A0A6U6R1T8_9DINO